MVMKENNSQAEAPSAGGHQFYYFTWEVYSKTILSNYLRDCQRCLGAVFETLIQVLNVIFTHFSRQIPHGVVLLQFLAEKLHKQVFALTEAKGFLHLEKDQAFSLFSLKSIQQLSLPPKHHKCFFSDSRRYFSLGLQRLYVSPFVHRGFFYKWKLLSAQKHGVRANTLQAFKKRSRHWAMFCPVDILND